METIVIHNSENNEILERPMTAAELKQWQADVAKENAKTEAKLEAENARLSLLNKLGITEEEAKLLLS